MGTKSIKPNDRLNRYICVETTSFSWRSIKDKLSFELEPVAVESFFSVAQLSLANIGKGIVPIGVAKALKVPESKVEYCYNDCD